MEKLKQDLQNYQINSKTYVKYDTDGLNQYQNYLYKRALYGLSSLTEQELATMCSKKKQRIINVYKKSLKYVSSHILLANIRRHPD